MAPIATITPIFLLIALGWYARRRGFIPPEFLAPANRLTYYFAIPALLFRAIAHASLRHEFHGGVLLATLAAAALAYGTGWLYSRLRRLPPERAGAVIQCAGHGNLGYIGLPFAYYFLGESGLVKAGILAGFLMILQNILSVSAWQAYTPDRQAGSRLKKVLVKLTGNPVILSSMAGIAVAALELGLPAVLQKTLDMLGGLAPPMALLLIGASLSLKAMRAHLRPVLVSVVIKLLLLPALGLGLYLGARLPAADFLPGLILLACPTATIAYVMAREMHGDADYVVAAISTSTLVSAGTFLLWLAVAGGLAAG